MGGSSAGLLLPVDIMNVSALEIQVGQEFKWPCKMDISAYLGTFKAKAKAMSSAQLPSRGDMGGSLQPLPQHSNTKTFCVLCVSSVC